MSIQTSIDYPKIAVAGMKADTSNEILSGYFVVNKLVSVAVGASDSQVYKVTITPTGIAPIVAQFTAGVGTTTALITVGLVAAINTAAGAYVVAKGSTTPFTIESRGLNFTAAYSAGTGTLTETVVTQGSPSAPPGVLLVINEAGNFGPLDYAVRLPKATADVTALAFGVTTLTVGTESGLHSSPGMADCLRQGRIWVAVEEPVTAGDPAFVRFAAGAGGSQLGAFRKSADSASSVALPNAKYLTDSTTDGLAIVQVDVK
jgi:hypothetical protein